jgi:glyoxylase I family protein
MKITGLDHYNVRVPKAFLESLCRFYVEVLNLHVGPRPPFRSSGYWLYAGDQPLLHLTGFESQVADVIEPRATGWFSHIAFRCEDLTATTARLGKLGVEYEMDTVPALGQTQLFFTDPAGIGVELNFAEGISDDE